MKYLFLVLGLCVLAPPTALADGTDEWAKLVILGSGGTRESDTQHLVRHGLTQEGAEALIYYVVEGLAKEVALRDAFEQRTCSNPPKDAEALATALEQHYAAEAALFAELAAGFDEKLSPTDQSQMVHLRNGHHLYVGGDKNAPTVVDKLRSGKRDFKEVLARICK